ncbi:phage tail protein [Nocardioides sp. GXZ039]|uniref:phage tail protein n=1 Tax=Nocardioides sp. GXZ039 TaxID=3136018 RepID=UPI0030F4A0DE
MDIEPYIGEIGVFGGGFAPYGWALCEGQVMPIQQNTALFALLGTAYGGNGTTTFGLPDLRGREPVSAGTGPGLSPYALGERVGSETVTLTTQQMPAHGHVPIASATAATGQATGSVWAPATPRAYRTGSAGRFTLATLGTAGSSQPHQNRQPYLVLNFCIALQGVFPSFD